MIVVSFVLFQALIFIGLIVMLRRILTQNVVSATKHLEDLNEEYTKKEIEITQRLEEVKQKSQDMLTKAKEEAQTIKAQIVKEAEEERDKMLQQAHSQSDDMIKQADKSRQLLLSEMNERIERGAVDRACELMQYTLPEKFKLDAHSHWVQELIETGFGQLEKLRIPQDTRDMRIASAFPLSAEHKKAILKRLKDVLGRDMELKEEVDPRIVAGIIITIGSLVLDGSLKNKINEQAEGIKHESSR